VTAASVSFGQFCADLGAPQKSAYSWCSVNRDQKLALFTIWDDEIDYENNTYQFWDEKTDEPRLVNSDGRKTKNPKEFKETLIECLNGNYQIYGIDCTAKDTKKSPRTRKSYRNDWLRVIRLEKTSTGIVGRFQDPVSASYLVNGGSGANPLIISGIDDLDSLIIGNETPERTAYSGTFIVRDGQVREAVRKRAKGRCEYCGELGFKMQNGDNYIEAHHIINLAKQGPDTLDNVIALCPNHHRQAHFGDDRVEIEAEFKIKLARIRGK
jgi:5-methylcytosine-specific restriction enzyme A